METAKDECCLVLFIEDLKEDNRKGRVHLGLDYSQFRMMRHYKIIQNIKLGWHLLYWSDEFLDSSEAPDLSALNDSNFLFSAPIENRTSKFVFFEKRQEVQMLKYDRGQNNFVPIEEEEDAHKFLTYVMSGVREGRLLENAKEFLIDFSVTDSDKWSVLTKHIGREVIAKVEPVDKKVCSSIEQEKGTKKKTHIFYSQIPRFLSKESVRRRNDRLDREKLKELERTVECLRDCDEGEERVPEKYMSYVPDDITLYNMDKFNILEELETLNYIKALIKTPDEDYPDNYPNKFFYILGEYQLAFVLYQLGFDYTSYLQWKRLYALITDSLTIIEVHANFFEEFLQTLHLQICGLSDDYFKRENESFILFGLFNINDIIICENISTSKIDQFMSLIDSIVHRKSGLHLNDLKDVFVEYEPIMVV